MRFFHAYRKLCVRYLRGECNPESAKRIGVALTRFGTAMRAFIWWLPQSLRVPDASMRICIVQPSLNTVSETFIRAHAERLPADVTVVHRDGMIPMLGQEPALSQSIPNRAFRKVGRLMLGRSWDWEVTNGYLTALQRSRSRSRSCRIRTHGCCGFAGVRVSGNPTGRTLSWLRRQYVWRSSRVWQSLSRIVSKGGGNCCRLRCNANDC